MGNTSVCFMKFVIKPYYKILTNYYFMILILSIHTPFALMLVAILSIKIGPISMECRINFSVYFFKFNGNDYFNVCTPIPSSVMRRIVV